MEAFIAGLAAVEPATLAKRAVRQGWLDAWLGSRERPDPIHVLALGKAAPRMVWGLVEAGVPMRGLGVAVQGIQAPLLEGFEWRFGEHPVPGPNSFAAGRHVQDWLAALPADAPLLVLISGGASSCVEAAKGIAEADLRKAWRDDLGAGFDIATLNRRRASHSLLKAGGMGRAILERTSRVQVWILADTDAADAPEVVGSGPCFLLDAPDAIPHRVLASVDELVVAAGLRLASNGFSVQRHGERIRGDVETEVDRFLAAFASIPGDAVALVGGGEATLRLPALSPPGGRDCHAALLAARWLSKNASGATFLCAASDGVDGGSKAAGGWVTKDDWTESGPSALAGFWAHEELDRRGRLILTGPTGTNVNDLWIALRS
jgi:glycerate 2-kinase